MESLSSGFSAGQIQFYDAYIQEGDDGKFRSVNEDATILGMGLVHENNDELKCYCQMLFSAEGKSLRFGEIFPLWFLIDSDGVATAASKPMDAKWIEIMGRSAIHRAGYWLEYNIRKEQFWFKLCRFGSSEVIATYSRYDLSVNSAYQLPRPANRINCVTAENLSTEAALLLAADLQVMTAALSDMAFFMHNPIGFIDLHLDRYQSAQDYEKEMRSMRISRPEALTYEEKKERILKALTRLKSLD